MTAALKVSMIFLSVIFWHPEVFAHARLRVPTPRNNSDALKTGPCGNVLRTNNPTVFSPGQTITVEWEETINHPGRYYISFSPNGDLNFEQNRLLEMVDQQDGAVNRNNPNTYHQYSAQVTLPNINCDFCTLQLIQSMEENPNAPTFYYSCADIRLASNNTAPPPTSPAPADEPPSADNQNTSLSDNANSPAQAQTRQKPEMGGGCGSIGHHHGSGPGGPSPAVVLFLLALPLLVIRFQVPNGSSSAPLKKKL